MILVEARIPVKAERQSKALSLLLTLAVQVRREPGCLGCDVLESQGCPGTLVLLQQWRSLEEWEAHTASRHLEECLHALTPCLEGDILAARYEVLTLEQEPARPIPVEQELPEVLISGEVTVH